MEYRVEEAMYNFVLDLHVCGISMYPWYPFTIKWHYPWWWGVWPAAMKAKTIHGFGGLAPKGGKDKGEDDGKGDDREKRRQLMNKYTTSRSRYNSRSRSNSRSRED